MYIYKGWFNLKALRRGGFADLMIDLSLNSRAKGHQRVSLIATKIEILCIYNISNPDSLTIGQVGMYSIYKTVIV